MNKMVSKFSLMAGVLLAGAFIFSCSSDDGNGPNSQQSGDLSSSSSSLLSEMVFCRLSDGTCPSTQISAEVCAVVGGLPVQSCAVSSSSRIYYPPSPYLSSSSGSSGGYTGSYGSLYYEGQTYKTVVIGTQTWMAENLNYNVSGSKCYSNSTSNCDKYGKLYDWSTAMALPSNCNTGSCSSQIQSPHRGICPSGWHIPSREEWNTLSSYVQSNSGCSGCDAKKLKATSGWNLNGNGTDDYGFSALPGGNGFSDGSFNNVGNSGYWWSASEYESNSYYAYNRGMNYYSVNAIWDLNNKTNLFSVRCLQD